MASKHREYIKTSHIYGYDVHNNVYPIVAVDSHGHLATTTIIAKNIHDGVQYGVGYYDSSLASSGTIDLLIQTNGYDLWTLLSLAAGGDALLQVYEGTTFSAAGTSLPPTNLNRTHSADSLEAVVTHTPTITADGTLIWQQFMPGGTGGNAAGGTLDTFQQGIFAPNEDYLLRLTNLAGTAQPCQLTALLYEDTEH